MVMLLILRDGNWPNGDFESSIPTQCRNPN
jgi:hypothetical protein